MTREEAIEILTMLICQDTRVEADDYEQALDMAIQALSQEPTNEKELNKAYTFGHNRGVKAYYNEQLCTVELPEAVFRYILSLVPTEEAEQEPCEDAISREAALEKMADYVASGYADSAEDFEEYSRIICQLPPVTQSITRDIEKSNFSQEQYLLDTGSAYQIGYEQGHKDAEQKSGEWDRSCTCSVCGQWRILESEKNGGKYKYCPNCGCRMVEPQESEE